jgi:hypothetical protein
MAAIPQEARDGLMRAWLEILREHHPGTSWIPAGESASENDLQEPADAQDGVSEVLSAA